MQGFIAELRRRNVLRAAAFYAAAGWLLVQVATQVLPFFDIPNGVVRLVVLAVAIGFVPAMLFSWFYELTPSGIHRESELAQHPGIARASGRATDRWIVGALLLAAALLLANLLRPHAPAAAMAAIADKSIAVLPFENLSDDKANAYFAEGIQDEILTKLARVGQLRVISRSSTAQYSAHPANLGEIARQLGVATILEGSVQKIGDAVHVNVQLIRAASDDHLWADSYDRKLDNVFGVESEVAQAIAQALQAQLSGGEMHTMAMRPTENMEAYDAYLRGLQLEMRAYHGSVPEPVLQAEDAFAAAVRLDPAFALAWAHLSMIKSYAYLNDFGRTSDAAQEIHQAADTALKLRPDLGEAYLAQGYVYYRVLHDLDGGLRFFHQALQLLPNNADVLASIAYIERRQGKWQDSTEHLEAAVRQDPRNTGMLAGLAHNYMALHQYPVALAVYDRALAVLPGDAELLAAKAGIELEQGDLDAADKLLAPLTASQNMGAVFETRLHLLVLRRQFSQAEASLRAMLDHGKDLPEIVMIRGPAYLGFLQSLDGRADAARAACVPLLQQARRLHPSGSEDIHLLGPFAVLEACAGDHAAALRDSQRWVDLTANDAVDRVQAEEQQVELQAWCGEPDAAVKNLQRLAAEPGGPSPASLRLDPAYDPLRHDPRFAALIAGQ